MRIADNEYDEPKERYDFKEIHKVVMKKEGPMIGKSDEYACKWLYEFKLCLNTREYKLRCPSKEERALWVRILNIII